MDLRRLRDPSLTTAQFRADVAEIARELAEQPYEEVTLIVILRSGLALLPAFLAKYPEAPVGFLGIERTKGLYYEDIPQIKGRTLILDPMCATGGTASLAIERLGTKDVTLIGILCSTPSKEKLSDIEMHFVAEDPELDDKKMISPGLGDFGERYFRGRGI